MIRLDENNILTMEAGDYGQFKLFIPADDSRPYDKKPRVLTNKDTLLFAIGSANIPFEMSEVRQMYKKEDVDENGYLLITLNSTDTKNLLPGTYYFELKVVTSDPGNSLNVDTLVTLYSKSRVYIL